MPTGQGFDINALMRLLQPNQGANFGQLGLGTALMGSTLLGRDEPGYVTEARQNVRNLSSPTGFASGFTNTVGGLQSQFQPLIEQQRNRSLDEISQRYTAAFPGTAGAQPQEFGGYASYLRDQFEPATQAFYGNLGLQGLNTQYQAAKTILDSAKPDPFKEGLAALAGSLILGGMGSGTGFLNQGTGGLGGLLGNFLGGGSGTGGGLAGGLGQAAGGALGGFLGGGGGGLGTLFGGAASAGQLAGLAKAGFSLGNAVGAGREILDATGYPVGVMTQSGQVTDIFGNSVAGTANLGGAGGAGAAGGFWAPQAAGSTGWAGLTSGQGLMGAPGIGSAAGIMSGLGAAGGGYAAGSFAAPHLTKFANRDDALKWLNPGAAGLESLGVSDQGLGAFTGAQGGALAGFAIAGPIGAAIGAVAGAIGGFTKVRAAEHMMKAQRLSADLESANTNEANMENFWMKAVASAGGDIDAFMSEAQRLGASDVDKIAAAGATSLLEAYNRGKPPGERISSVGAIPGFREAYIADIMQNNRIEVGGRSVAPSDISQQAQLLASAGIRVPGNAGVLAVAGEDTGHMITQSFRNPDQPSRAEADELAGKLRAAGYTGALPADWYNMPGAIMNQKAAQLLRGF